MQSPAESRLVGTWRYLRIYRIQPLVAIAAAYGAWRCATQLRFIL